MKNTKITKDFLHAKMNEAIYDIEKDGEMCTNCTILIGQIKLSDGRKVQIHVSIEADESNWIDND